MECVGIVRTLIQLEIGNGLPFVCRHKPSVVFFATTEIDDELRGIVLQSSEDGVESGVREGGRREEI